MYTTISGCTWVLEIQTWVLKLACSKHVTHQAISPAPRLPVSNGQISCALDLGGLCQNPVHPRDVRTQATSLPTSPKPAAACADRADPAHDGKGSLYDGRKHTGVTGFLFCLGFCPECCCGPWQPWSSLSSLTDNNSGAWRPALNVRKGTRRFMDFL